MRARFSSKAIFFLCEKVRRGLYMGHRAHPVLRVRRRPLRRAHPGGEAAGQDHRQGGGGPVSQLVLGAREGGPRQVLEYPPELDGADAANLA